MSMMGPNETVTTSEQATKDSRIAELKAKHDKERKNLSLIKSPRSTLKLFSKALLVKLGHLWSHVSAHRLTFLLCSAFAVAVGMTMFVTEGHHKLYVKEILAWARFVVWWIALGVASSIGLGSGLHTFVLYLGPHIAMFTMMATRCGRVDFKSAAYDTAQWALAPSWAVKTCPQIGSPMFPKGSEGYMVPLLSILFQVQLEAILWGCGTALGELPPYFVSRQALLAGEKLKEFEERVSTADSPSNSLFDRLKRWMVMRIKNFGFFTILLLASVPNPLFDVAGILCGQFKVPFWKFFSATLIGKALIKTHIQTVFIIMVSNPHVVELMRQGLVGFFAQLPVFAHLMPSITTALDNAKANIVSPLEPQARGNVVAFAWNSIVWVMMLGFAGSIVTSVAQGVLVEQQNSELLEATGGSLIPSLNSGHDRQKTHVS